MDSSTTVTQPYIDWGNATTAVPMTGGCPWCNGIGSITVHGGACPKVKAIEYYPDGVTVKRVEFKDG